ncbi:hypothetical protein MNBD_GAMMA22-2080 [hydrothermal vent metagenome]|uniref:GYF domain-containing protein n=1 Tax=hydrothermal vent metagenome TaxID=652676 RepID=A0A3B1AP90_9ZZZZ
MAEQRWWYSKNGQHIGPETLEALHKLANTGILQRTTLVWCDGMDEWLEAQHVKEFNTVFKEPPPLPNDFKPVSKIFNGLADNDNEKIKLQLSADVRNKYIATLFKAYYITGIALGILAGIILIIIIVVNTEIRTIFFIVMPFLGGSIGLNITNKIQRIRFKDKSDELIQVLYNDHIKKKNIQDIISSITGSIVVVFIIGVFIFSEQARYKTINLYKEITSSTKCVLVSSSAHEDAFFIKKQSDYGYTVKAKVKNTGDAGQLSLVAKLITSEGSFSQKQKFHLKAGETIDLAFQFSEPTVNATNVRYKLKCK